LKAGSVEGTKLKLGQPPSITFHGEKEMEKKYMRRDRGGRRNQIFPIITTTKTMMTDLTVTSEWNFLK